MSERDGFAEPTPRALEDFPTEPVFAAVIAVLVANATPLGAVAVIAANLLRYVMSRMDGESADELAACLHQSIDGMREPGPLPPPPPEMFRAAVN